ncbi:MAG: cytochrome C [Deltaproteobacteria bacterium]|jgi:predicted CXXCH cytochrome family protein|nr:cytochrome C [Deltaproteobacteria bacterium]
MKRTTKGTTVVGAITIVMALLLAAGCQQTQKVAATSEAEAVSAEEKGTEAAKTEEMEDVSMLYDFEPDPLRTVAQCAQCHIYVFEQLKKEGGKHQIECVQCHTEFHRYNPKTRPYETVIPKCATCHELFHGKGTTEVPLDDCAACHIDPHMPLVIPSAAIENACASCHKKEGDEVANNVSRHTTEVACVDCHADTHGFIPECSACHESHSPGVEMNSSNCMICHPVHMPTKIAYATDTSSVICAGCHDAAYGLLQKNHTAHTDLTCAECHKSHAKIPPCSECHGLPHSKMMMDTSKCGDCHGIAHDLAS